MIMRNVDGAGGFFWVRFLAVGRMFDNQFFYDKIREDRQGDGSHGDHGLFKAGVEVVDSAGPSRTVIGQGDDEQEYSGQPKRGVRPEVMVFFKGTGREGGDE